MAAPHGHSDEIRADIAGVVCALNASVGATVLAGQTVLSIESMKMEFEAVAPLDGMLVELRVEVGDVVAEGDVVAIFVAASTTG